jgi:DNA repair exonuclease SbcCD ATPase subunit
MTQEKQQSTIDKCFELATDKLRQNDIGKREIIRDLAKDLEKAGMPKNMISAEITRRCREWMTPQYARKCLGEEYKQESKTRLGNNIRKRIEDSSIPQPDVEKTEPKLVQQVTATSAGGVTVMGLEQSQPETQPMDHHAVTTTAQHDRTIKDRDKRIEELEDMLSQQQKKQQEQQQHAIAEDKRRIQELEDRNTKLEQQLQEQQHTIAEDKKKIKELEHKVVKLEHEKQCFKQKKIAPKSQPDPVPKLPLLPPKRKKSEYTIGTGMVQSIMEFARTFTDDEEPECTQEAIDKSRNYRLSGIKQCDMRQLNIILNYCSHIHYIFQDMRTAIDQELETRKETGKFLTT